MKIVKTIVKYVLVIIGLIVSSFAGNMTYHLIKGTSGSPALIAILFFIGISILLSGLNINTKDEDEEEYEEA